MAIHPIETALKQHDWLERIHPQDLTLPSWIRLAKHIEQSQEYHHVAKSRLIMQIQTLLVEGRVISAEGFFQLLADKPSADERS